jgi:8-oxo-dGTP pyrophosphatase MutT (NUDIX family)
MTPLAAALLADLDVCEAAFSDGRERSSLARVRNFVSRSPAAFSRANPEGHITASAVITRPEDAAFLLVWHRKLARWLQPGGHMEPSDASVFATARREAQEETGIEDFAFPIGDRILDVDVHAIPAHGPDSAHFHYDIRYLFTVEEPTPPLLDETTWFSLPQALAAGVDESLTRALRKATGLLRSSAPVPTTYHLPPNA